MKSSRNLLRILLLAMLPCLRLAAQIPWTQATSAAPWSPRSYQVAVVHDGKIWLLGGWGASMLHDVWYSSDGAQWDQATSTAGWEPRIAHSALSYHGKLWVFGGINANFIPLNDVWSSSDGVQWDEVTAAAPWSPRGAQMTVVFHDTMWLMGGTNSDVWYSTDGLNWDTATTGAEWGSGRQYAGVTVFHDTLWLTGGFPGLKEVWYSADARHWTKEPGWPVWRARYGHGCITYDDRIWVMGGSSQDGNLSDVWYSEDGLSWNRGNAEAPWLDRGLLSALVMNNRMWVIGGFSYGTFYNDDWYSCGLGIAEQPSVPTDPPAFRITGPGLFRTEAEFEYDLTRAMPVRIAVSSINGQRVKVLANGSFGPGHHVVHWDGTDDAGRAVAEGVYLVHLEVPELDAITKVVRLTPLKEHFRIVHQIVCDQVFRVKP